MTTHKWSTLISVKTDSYSMTERCWWALQIDGFHYWLVIDAIIILFEYIRMTRYSNIFYAYTIIVEEKEFIKIFYFLVFLKDKNAIVSWQRQVNRRLRIEVVLYYFHHVIQRQLSLLLYVGSWDPEMNHVQRWTIFIDSYCMSYVHN